MMETQNLGHNLLSRNGILYPMLVIAAVAVIIFSAFGVATITGLIPAAQPNSVQQQDLGPKTQPQSAQPAVKPARTTSTRDAAIACEDCGVVETIKVVEVTGNANGLGMIAGGVTGALIGNQIGRGNGNAVATIAGAAGGAFAGNEIEKNMKKSLRYQVRVRMDDGTSRTLFQSSAPAFAVGEKVKVVNGRVVAGG
jgi:outer membrane lipoprotein SlyB